MKSVELFLPMEPEMYCKRVHMRKSRLSFIGLEICRSSCGEFNIQSWIELYMYDLIDYYLENAVHKCGEGDKLINEKKDEL